MNTILDTFLSKKGQIATITTVRSVKIKKAYNEKITKKSVFQCRIGCNYDNLKSVQEKREIGVLPTENQGLPYGEWIVPNYTIKHNDTIYLRCTSINSSNTPKVEFYNANNEIVSSEYVKSISLASEFYDKTDNDVFNLKIDSVIDIK